MDKTSFKLGNEYKVTFYDHCTTENKAPKDAAKIKVKMTCWGRCVGINDEYVILSFFWENDASENNDNVHILKSGITKKEIL